MVYLSTSRIVAKQCLNRGSPFWYCYALLLLSGATDFKLIQSIWWKLDRRRGRIKLLVLTCGESRRRADSYTSWLKSLVKEGILHFFKPSLLSAEEKWEVLASSNCFSSWQHCSERKSNLRRRFLLNLPALGLCLSHCGLANNLQWQSFILSTHVLPTIPARRL